MPVIYNGDPTNVEYTPYADARIGQRVVLETMALFYARRSGGTQDDPRSCYVL